ncbi:MAG: hypothetical protein PHD56_11830 [Anaerostipes sp.]|nr:hypothetical protein [Anaerostipes sp.]
MRMSLEDEEVTAKIIGEGAKNLAIMIAAIVKEEQKTKGNEREKYALYLINTCMKPFV